MGTANINAQATAIIASTDNPLLVRAAYHLRLADSARISGYFDTAREFLAIARAHVREYEDFRAM